MLVILILFCYFLRVQLRFCISYQSSSAFAAWEICKGIASAYHEWLLQRSTKLQRKHWLRRVRSKISKRYCSKMKKLLAANEVRAGGSLDGKLDELVRRVDGMLTSFRRSQPTRPSRPSRTASLNPSSYFPKPCQGNGKRFNHQPRGKKSNADARCYRCHGFGHYAATCPNRRKNNYKNLFSSEGWSRKETALMRWPMGPPLQGWEQQPVLPLWEPDVLLGSDIAISIPGCRSAVHAVS